MPQLTKATLEEVTNSGDPLVVPIQFNPTSLRLQIGNRTEGGEQPGRQARQYIGTGSATLSLELVFDTADEGTTGWPRSVLEYTSLLEYFITPRRAGDQHVAPPRARFSWSEFSIEGVVEQLTVELDHFAHDGTPLRAKAALSIKGQNPDYQFITVGPGSSDAPAPGAPGDAAAGAAPGAANNPFSQALNGLTNNPVTDALGDALDGTRGAVNAANGAMANALSGESLAELAQRAGLNPAAWRGLANGLSNPLSLGAGVGVSLGGGLIGLPGAGLRTGAQAGVRQGAAAALGLSSSSKPARGVNATLSQGYAISGAAGVGQAVQSVKAQEAQARVEKARLAFASPQLATAAQIGAVRVSGAGGLSTGVAATGGVTAAPILASGRANPSAVVADPRAQSYGADVPLRPRRRTGADDRAEALNGSGRPLARGDGLPPTTTDPSTPAWRALPRRAAGGAVRASHASGCGCGCGCSGGRR